MTAGAICLAWSFLRGCENVVGEQHAKHFTKLMGIGKRRLAGLLD